MSGVIQANNLKENPATYRGPEPGTLIEDFCLNVKRGEDYKR